MPILERLLTPAELAETWKLDVSTIRRMFQDRPGVMKIGNAVAARGKRSYQTLRIPESVAQKFFVEHSK
jgi:hypothetical protein